MNDIGKEVIKHQPENILEFIAKYLEKRVDQLRRRDPLRKDLSSYSEIERSLPRETRIVLDECGIDLYTAEKAATTIQATFRGYSTRQLLKKERNDSAECESDNNVTSTDNTESISENTDEGIDSVNKVNVEKSSSTIRSSTYTIPEVDYKASKPSIDLASNYEQLSLVDYEGDDYRGTATIERPSFTHSMISTNTITRDMQQQSNTYLDLTQVVYRKSIDPFKEVEPAVITSDVEILKHIDMDNYEDDKTFNSNNDQKGLQGGYPLDEVSSSVITSEASTQKSREVSDDLDKRLSLERKSISPKTSSGTAPESHDKGDGVNKTQSSHEVLKSPRSSHEVLKSPRSSHEELKPPRSSHEVLKSPRSSHEELKPPRSSHEVLKSPRSSHEELKPPRSSHEVLKPPRSSGELKIKGEADDVIENSRAGDYHSNEDLTLNLAETVNEENT
ncbi:uncharacterized protein LOC111057642 isoform X2 [Nilaparvata lugens]|nr:uncharacterized protein LOC111057642 isoform X2 [Nilaparvata lugens]